MLFTFNRACLLLAMAMSAGAAFASVEEASLTEKGIADEFAWAQTLYRSRSSTDPSPTNRAIEVLAAVEGKAEDPNLNYDIYILEADLYYWKAMHATAKDDKLKAFLTSQAKADLARAIDDSYADAFYYAGRSLGRWCEIVGVFQSISKIPQLEGYMNDSMARDTRQGAPGDSIDGFGPYRFFGNLYKVAPAFAGGGHKRSVQNLSKAFNGAPLYVHNVYSYAATLIEGTDPAEKALAIRILDDILAKDPNSLLPDRVVESIEEQVLCKKLRDQIKG